VTARVVELAVAFLAQDPPDPWRAVFDEWAMKQGLSQEVRRAVVVEILRQRVFAAVQRGQAKRRPTR